MPNAVLLAFLVQSSPVVATPTTPWEMQLSPMACTLRRAFEAGGKSLVVEIEPRLAATTYDVRIIGKASELPSVTSITTAASISLGEPLTEDSFAFTSDTTDGRRFVSSALSQKALDMAPPSGQLTLISRAFSVRFSMPGVGKAISALKTCHGDLLLGWKLNPALWFAGRMAHFSGNPGRFFSDESYPASARARRVSGRVTALLNIDELGTITNCRVIDTPDDALGKTTCEIARTKMKALPALGDDGKPMASYAFLPVRWSL